MAIKNLITNYADYNLWANERYAHWLSEKSDELLNQEILSSYPSILKTLNHIWSGEEYWFAVITKTKDFQNRFNVKDFQKDEILKGLVNRSNHLASAIKSLSEKELIEKIHVVSPWFEARLPRYEYLQHQVNHGTYHRGQIVTMCRNIGITDAPLADYIIFNISKKNNLTA
jgi:uncharacterized damage-inducible protein DinB